MRANVSLGYTQTVVLLVASIAVGSVVMMSPKLKAVGEREKLIKLNVVQTLLFTYILLLTIFFMLYDEKCTNAT